MEVASGILTSRGGMTSHAAVVTRGMGKCCVAGAGDCTVDEAPRNCASRATPSSQGDWISLDGTTGRVIEGKLKTLPAQPDDPDLVKFMSWVDPVRRLKIRANADIPRDAKQARLFGAEGIGLCRTEHMFFAEDRIEHMRAMILRQREGPPRSAQEAPAHAARRLCRPLQGHGIAAGHHPPARSAAARVPAPARRSAGRDLAPGRHQAPLAQAQGTASAAGARPGAARDEPHARPARLPPRHRLPEITEMQARAIFEAAVTVKAKGGDPHLEIMVPLIGSIEEMRNQAAIIRRVAARSSRRRAKPSTTWWAP
jgi:pyruvate, orthophosphate dikinase